MIKTENERAERRRGSEPNVIEGINVDAAVYSAAIRDEAKLNSRVGKLGWEPGKHTHRKHTHTHRKHTVPPHVCAAVTERAEHTHRHTWTLYHRLSNKHTHTHRKFGVWSHNLCGKFSLRAEGEE